jgi:hypothetical protein
LKRAKKGKGAKNKLPKAKKQKTETEPTKKEPKKIPQTHPSTSPEKQNRWGLVRKEGREDRKASNTRVCG